MRYVEKDAYTKNDRGVSILKGIPNSCPPGSGVVLAASEPLLKGIIDAQTL